MNHADIAAENFLSGYSCAQSVFAAFSDVCRMSKTDMLRLSSPFGAGMGRMREVCGAVSGMFMVLGILYGNDKCSDISAKTEIYRKTRILADRFKEKYETIICRELIKNIKTKDSPEPEERNKEYYEKRPCLKLVRCAAMILDDFIKENEITEVTNDVDKLL